MQESTTKEKVLKKIRKALIHKTKNPFPKLDFDTKLYALPDELPEILFAKQFTSLGGKFVFCENEYEFIENIISLANEKKWDSFLCWEEKIKKHLDEVHFPYFNNDSFLKNAAVSLTLCEYLIARTGSVLISSKQTAGRRLPIFPPVHVVLAYSSQFVFEIKDGLQNIKTKYGDQMPSMISMITGPSRTADIEKTLVTGAHGPKEIFVFLIDDSNPSS